MRGGRQGGFYSCIAEPRYEVQAKVKLKESCYGLNLFPGFRVIHRSVRSFG